MGSPAHAGIDLHDCVDGTACYRFPRTRGDRPYGLERSPESTAVPPHTRG